MYIQLSEHPERNADIWCDEEAFKLLVCETGMYCGTNIASESLRPGHSLWSTIKRAMEQYSWFYGNVSFGRGSLSDREGILKSVKLVIENHGRVVDAYPPGCNSIEDRAIACSRSVDNIKRFIMKEI